MEDLGREENRKGSRWRTVNGQQISGPVKIRESNLESFRLINLCGDLFISVEQITGGFLNFVGLFISFYFYFGHHIISRSSSILVRLPFANA